MAGLLSTMPAGEVTCQWWDYYYRNVLMSVSVKRYTQPLPSNIQYTSSYHSVHSERCGISNESCDSHVHQISYSHQTLTCHPICGPVCGPYYFTLGLSPLDVNLYSITIITVCINYSLERLDSTDDCIIWGTCWYCENTDWGQDTGQHAGSGMAATPENTLHSKWSYTALE